MNVSASPTECTIAIIEAQRDAIVTLPAALLRRAFSGELYGGSVCQDTFWAKFPCIQYGKRLTLGQSVTFSPK